MLINTVIFRQFTTILELLTDPVIIARFVIFIAVTFILFVVNNLILELVAELIIPLNVVLLLVEILKVALLNVKDVFVRIYIQVSATV